MFGKMGDMGKMMKQAQEMQARMADMQNQIELLTVEGVSGGGMVSITLSGKGLIKGMKIDPSLLSPEEGEILEDLIMAAHNDAKGKAEAMVAEKTKEIMGDLQLPEGMNLGF